MSDTKNYGHLTAGAGTPQERKIPLLDFTKAFYKDGRLIVIAGVEGGGVSISVENHASSGRAPQQGMWLSEESFIALLSSAFIYYTCKGVDMGALLMNAVENDKKNTRFVFSDNLNPPATWKRRESAEQATPNGTPYSKLVADLDISVRLYNCLRAAEYKTVGDLAVLDRSKLLTMRNFGRKSLAELEATLAELGLDLK